MGLGVVANIYASGLEQSDGWPKLERWHKDTIYEAFEIGPEATIKTRGPDQYER